MDTFRRICIVLITTFFLPIALAAQVQGPNTPVSSDSSAAPQTGSATGSLEQPAMEPQMDPTYAERVEAPRTLRGYWHLFIAFALAWALLFGYALFLGGRFRRLERDVQRLS